LVFLLSNVSFIEKHIHDYISFVAKLHFFLFKQYAASLRSMRRMAVISRFLSVHVNAKQVIISGAIDFSLYPPMFSSILIFHG